MITPLLERLILTGKARFKNWSYGCGQLGCLPVVTGQTVIIVDFTVFPYHFMKNNRQTIQEPKAQENLSLLRIESLKTVNDYVIKFPHYVGTAERPAFYGIPLKFDCFNIHTNNIQIRFAVFPDDTTWIFTNFPPNFPKTDSEEPVMPLGYALNPVLNNINFGATIGTYNPMTSVHNQTALGADGRDELNINFNGLTLPMIDSTAAPVSDQVPLVNFSCVYLEENLSNELLSSK